MKYKPIAVSKVIYNWFFEDLMAATKEDQELQEIILSGLGLAARKAFKKDINTAIFSPIKRDHLIADLEIADLMPEPPDINWD